MKNARNGAKAAKALPSPAEASPLQATEEKRRKITLPVDPAAQRQAIRDVFVNTIGANVLSQQLQPFVTDGDGKTDASAAELFVQSIRESVQPRDAIEEMLVVQMVWTHARLARLSAIAHNQELRRNAQVVHDACDRAANTFRRQMLMLAEYRRPPQPNNFMAIRQANVANQQVVQNVESGILPNAKPSNEQGSGRAALPSIAEGIDRPAGNGAEKQAVAAEHRSQDERRQGTIKAERDEARRP